MIGLVHSAQVSSPGTSSHRLLQLLSREPHLKKKPKEFSHSTALKGHYFGEVVGVSFFVCFCFKSRGGQNFVTGLLNGTYKPNLNTPDHPTPHAPP